MIRSILLMAVLCVLSAEDDSLGLHMISSVRGNSIIGLSGGVGIYQYSDRTFGDGLIGMVNIGYGGMKVDLGYAGWATPDGCRKDWVNPYYFPVGLGLAAKGSIVTKWMNEEDDDSEFASGYGNSSLYFGGSLDFQVIIPMLELGYYRSFDLEDEVIALSFGAGF